MRTRAELRRMRRDRGERIRFGGEELAMVLVFVAFLVGLAVVITGIGAAAGWWTGNVPFPPFH